MLYLTCDLSENSELGETPSHLHWPPQLPLLVPWSNTAQNSRETSTSGHTSSCSMGFYLTFPGTLWVTTQIKTQSLQHHDKPRAQSRHRAQQRWCALMKRIHKCRSPVGRRWPRVGRVDPPSTPHAPLPLIFHMHTLVLHFNY